LRTVIPKLDLIGCVFYAPAAIMFLLALQFGADGKHSWNSPSIIGLFCGAGVTAIMFFAWEWHMGDLAMIPGSIIKKRQMWASTGQALCLMVCVLVGSNYMPIYFQTIRGESPTMSGVDLLPSILSQLLFSVVSGASGNFFSNSLFMQLTIDQT
jgi:hypothetical protein